MSPGLEVVDLAGTDFPENWFWLSSAFQGKCWNFAGRGFMHEWGFNHLAFQRLKHWVGPGVEGKSFVVLIKIFM